MNTQSEEVQFFEVLNDFKPSLGKVFRKINKRFKSFEDKVEGLPQKPRPPAYSSYYKPLVPSTSLDQVSQQLGVTLSVDVDGAHQVHRVQTNTPLNSSTKSPTVPHRSATRMSPERQMLLNGLRKLPDCPIRITA